MPTPLDDQSTAALTLAQNRAEAHLLAWTSALWIASAGLLLLILAGSIREWLQCRHGADIRTAITGTAELLLIPGIPAFASWRAGCALMQTRKAIPTLVRFDLDGALLTFDVLLLITLPLLLVGLLVAAVIHNPIARITLTGTPPALAILALWSRRQLRKLYHQLPYLDPRRQD